ncbi:MAG: STAS domain-containing protein [Gammaproteobacteria bacterium]|nr:STAS domain-containing protein [Gammaproteobacteria bacterium]
MSTNPTITATSPTEFKLSGCIDFDNVENLLREGRDIISKASAQVKFNFSGIDQSNSAGLALLTGLLRHANENRKNILFLQLPAKVLAAAKACDLDAILPCSPTTSAT